MKTSQFKLTIPQSHNWQTVKKMASWRARIPHKDTQRRLRSDSGGQRGKRSPFEKFGNFDVRKCPLLASEDEFSSYLIQSCIQNSSILHASNCIFGPLPLVFGTSNHEIRDPRPKIQIDKFSNLISQSIFLTVFDASILPHSEI